MRRDYEMKMRRDKKVRLSKKMRSNPVQGNQVEPHRTETTLTRLKLRIAYQSHGSSTILMNLKGKNKTKQNKTVLKH